MRVQRCGDDERERERGKGAGLSRCEHSGDEATSHANFSSLLLYLPMLVYARARRLEQYRVLIVLL